MCNLKRVLLIPKLAYNLLSVSKASDAGKIVKLDESGCRILNSSSKCIAFATKMGSLYYLSYSRDQHHLNVTTKVNEERLLDCRYGHLSDRIYTSWLERG